MAARVLVCLLLSPGLGACKTGVRSENEAVASGSKPTADGPGGSQPTSDDPSASKPASNEPQERTSEANDAPPAPPDLATPPADAQKTASGLVTKVLRVGTGDKTPKANDQVRVHFTGWKTSGKVINSSRGGEPVTFALSDVIPGWAEGLQLMRVGEQRRLWIPDHLSYVRPGRPTSPVVFDIELIAIVEGETRPAPPDVAAAPSDATKTKSGLAYKVLAAGANKDKPNPWDRVTLRYAGWTTDGAMFEIASKATFDVGNVMPGWAEALPRMAVGERARLWIPEPLAYQGRQGRPRGMVVFDLELLSIERRPEPPRPPPDVAAPPKQAKRTASGLAYRMVAKGKGTVRPSATSRVQVRYSGWTTDGKLFDSSVVLGKPKTVPLGSVIAGWREGLQLMVEGDKAILWVPQKLAYKGAPGAPPGMLVYELELLKIVK